MDRLPGPHHAVFAQIDEVRAFNRKKIEEHIQTLDPNSPRDYIDCFLIRMNQVKIVDDKPKILYQLLKDLSEYI